MGLGASCQVWTLLACSTPYQTSEGSIHIPQGDLLDDAGHFHFRVGNGLVFLSLKAVVGG